MAESKKIFVDVGMGFPVSCEEEVHSKGGGDGAGQLGIPLGKYPSQEPAQKLQLDGHPEEYQLGTKDKEDQLCKAQVTKVQQPAQAPLEGYQLPHPEDHQQPHPEDCQQTHHPGGYQQPIPENSQQSLPEGYLSLLRSLHQWPVHSPDDCDRAVAGVDLKAVHRVDGIPTPQAMCQSAILNVGDEDLSSTIDPVHYAELGIQSGVQHDRTHEILPSGSDRFHVRETFEVRYDCEKDLVTIARKFENENFAGVGSESQTGVILHNMRRQLTITDGRYDARNYKILKKLGQGQQGSCLKARDLRSGFQFCVKEIINTAEYRYEEVMFLIKLSEVDGVVKVFGATKMNGRVHILMELLHGGNLADWITRRRSSRSVDRDEMRILLNIFRKILMLMFRLKDKNILHEDIKALNIILSGKKDRDLVPYLVDFGAARSAPVPQEFPIKGTITHCSPEKVRSEGYGFPAEVYAATTTFMHMLEGTVPYSDLEIKEKIILKVGMHGPPDVPLWIPPAVRNMVKHGWNMEPDQRATAEQLVENIDRVLSGDMDDVSDDSCLDRSISSQTSADESLVSPTTLGVQLPQAESVQETDEDEEEDDGDFDEDSEYDEESDEDGEDDEESDEDVEDDEMEDDGAGDAEKCHGDVDEADTEGMLENDSGDDDVDDEDASAYAIVEEGMEDSDGQDDGSNDADLASVDHLNNQTHRGEPPDTVSFEFLSLHEDMEQKCGI